MRSKQDKCVCVSGLLVLTSVLVLYVYSTQVAPWVNSSYSPLRQKVRAAANCSDLSSHPQRMPSVDGIPGKTNVTSQHGRDLTCLERHVTTSPPSPVQQDVTRAIARTGHDVRVHSGASRQGQNRPLGADVTRNVSAPSAARPQKVKDAAPSPSERKNGSEAAPQAGRAVAERFPWFVNESSRHPEEVHHVVFVKVGLTPAFCCLQLAASP